MKKKALLFACIEKNIGDDLFIYLVCKRYPNTTFTISSAAQYGTLKELPNLKFDEALNKWCSATGTETTHFLKRVYHLIREKVYENKIEKHDIGVYVVGNAFKNMNYTGKNQSYWIKKRIDIVEKFYLMSTNFGPYKDERWKNDFLSIYPTMEDVCFRDVDSYGLFKDLPNVRYAPDAVISFGRQERVIEEKGYKRLLISIIDCAFSVRSDALKAAAPIYEQSIAEIIDLFQNRGYKVTIINSNTEQDSPACHRILDMCEQSEGVDVINYEGNLERIFEAYRTADGVIATRLHPIILGWLYNLPVIPLVYDKKVLSLLKSYDFTSDYYKVEEMQKVNPQEVYNIIETYDYKLPDEIIFDSNKQFEMLDKALL